MDEKRESADWRVILLVVLALLGAWISLTLNSFHLSGGQAGPGVFRAVCAMTGGGCDQILQSPWAVLPRQIPTAFAGLIYFSAIALWYLVVGRPNRAGRSWYAPVFALQILGVLFSLFLFAVMFLQVGALCGWCALVHLINFVLLGLAWKLWPRGPKAAEAAWPPARLGFAALLLVFVAAAFWNQWLLARFFQAEAARFRGDTDLMRYLHIRNPAQQIPLRADDPVRGPGAAAHTVVVFSDFQCPACRGFAAFFKNEIQPLYGDRLRLVYKHLPLDSDCNAPLSKTIHANACEAAHAAEAARELGGSQGFWKMHDALFERQADVAEGRWAELAASAGLDGAAVAQRVAQRRHLDRIEEDVRLGGELKIHGTPGIYIDGRPLPEWTSLDLWKAILGAPAGPPETAAPGPPPGTSTLR